MAYSFFEFSPVAKEKVPKTVKCKAMDDANELPTLMLIPFSRIPKIVFEDVKLNSRCIRQLVLKNTTDRSIMVTLVKLPHPEICLQFGWHEISVNARSEEILDVIWTPIVAQCTSFTLGIQSSQSPRLKFDVTIVLKTSPSSIKKKRNVKPKAPTFKTKSPVINRKKVNFAIVSQPLCMPSIDNCNISDGIGNKENISVFGNTYIKSSPLLQSDRRNTFTVIPNASKYTPLCNKDIFDKSGSPLKQNVDTDKSPIFLRPQVPGIVINCDGVSSSPTLSPVKSDTKLSLCRDEIHGYANSTAINSSAHTTRFQHDRTLQELQMSGIGARNAIEANLWASGSSPKVSLASKNFNASTPSYYSTPGGMFNDLSCIRRPKASKKSPTDNAFLKGKTQISRGIIKKPETNYSGRNSFIFATKSPSTSKTYIATFSMPAEDESTVGLNARITTSAIHWLNAIFAQTYYNSVHSHIDLKSLWNEIYKKYSNNNGIECATNSEKNLSEIRAIAKSIFESTQFNEVMEKVRLSVEMGKLCIRQDRNLHLDVILKGDINKLLHCYNPKWLRIGLETIFGKSIEVESYGSISNFLETYFFKDAFLIKKCGSIHSPTYGTKIKRKMLYRFLCLVYLLDQSMQRNTVPQYSCLFLRNAGIRESRAILTHFALALVQSIGDICKELQKFGYIVTYQQTHLHEYDFFIKNPATDLRDGVRLTRSAEVIFGESLQQQLRIPVISRLQKVHNMKIAFDAFHRKNVSIPNEVTPTDIVDGNTFKTLQLLCSIVDRYHQPLLDRKARIVQRWWRSFYISIKRRLRHRSRQVSAAIVIQKSWRCLQCWYRYNLIRNSVIVIQRWWRQICVAKDERSYYLALRSTTVWAQARIRRNQQRSRYLDLYKAVVCAQKNFKMIQQRRMFESLKASCIVIQRWFRSVREMRACRAQFVLLRRYAVQLQQIYKSKKEMRIVRTEYIRIRTATFFIQRTFRAGRLRLQFLQLKQSALIVQRLFRSNQLCKKMHTEYVLIRACTVRIQAWFRGCMQRKKFLKLKQAALAIQSRYRAKRTAAACRQNYVALRNNTLVIQRCYRALVSMRIQRQYFLELRCSVLYVQQKFRANQLCRKMREEFCELRKAVIVVQRFYRARMQRRWYLRQIACTTLIQHWYRGIRDTRLLSDYFTRLRCAAILIQRIFKAKLLAREQHRNYLDLKQATVWIQRKFRANRLCKEQHQYYLRIRVATVCIQSTYRAKIQRNKYLTTKKSALVFQRRYRALLKMRKCLREYNDMRNAVLTIQRRFRAYILAKQQKEYYNKLHHACIVVQAAYRRFTKRKRFCEMKHSAIVIQVRYRAWKNMLKIRHDYLNLKRITVNIQVRWRATQLSRCQRIEFVALRIAVVTIQANYKALIQRRSYLRKQWAACIIQKHYRAYKSMQQARHNYLQLLKYSVFVQRHYRNKKLVRQLRCEYLQLRKYAMFIQQSFRAKKQRKLFLKFKCAAICIQRRYIATRLMYNQRRTYLNFRSSVLIIQRSFRSLRIIRSHKAILQKLRDERRSKAAITIQRFVRGFLVRRKWQYLFSNEAKQQRLEHRRRVAAAIKIQKLWRGYRVRSSSLKNPKLRAISERCTQAIKSSEPKITLEHCHRNSVDILSRKCALNQILIALYNLDYTTRHSKLLCLDLEYNIFNSMYEIILQCNRSLPDMNAGVLATHVLLNCARLDETRPKSWYPQHINAFIGIMLHVCDKEHQLFPALATLLWIFVHEPEYLDFILKLPNLNYNIKTMRSLCLRRAGMVAKMDKGFKTLFTWPCMQNQLPILTPDWGIDLSGTPRLFTNSVFAANSLCEILRVKYK